MKRNLRLLTILAALLVTTFLSIEQNAQARVGGGGSMGSRGSRSYSRPVAPPSQSTPYQQAAPQQTPRPFSPSPFQTPQPAGGGRAGQCCRRDR